jgi:hypothetical protein
MPYHVGSTVQIDRRFEVFTASIIRAIITLMEAVSTSETLFKCNHTTRRNISEDSHFNSRRHENLKSSSFVLLFSVMDSNVVTFFS